MSWTLRLVEWIWNTKSLEERYRFCSVRFAAQRQSGDDLVDLTLVFLQRGLALLRRPRPHNRLVGDPIPLREFSGLTKSRLQGVGRKQFRVAPCTFDQGELHLLVTRTGQAVHQDPGNPDVGIAVILLGLGGNEMYLRAHRVVAVQAC